MAAAAAASKKAGQWVPPLPHGWEARYDEENKAFFFIDHLHKQTQWVDPRFQAPQKQNQPPPSTSAAAVSSLGRGGGGPIKSYGAIALQDFSSGQPQKDRRQNSRSTVGEASLTNEVDTALVNKLKAEFPNATKELITDMLVLCHNSERQTRDQLKDLGFFVSSSTARSSNHASPHKKASGGPAPTKRSPDKHPQVAAASATSPTRKEISEADKRKMLAKAKELFPKIDQYVIGMSLNECHHNWEEVKALLSAWEKSYGNTDQAKGATAGSGNASVSSSVSSVRAFSPAAGSLEPRGLEEDVANKADQRSSQWSAHSASHTLSPKRSTAVPSVTQMLAKGDAAPSKSSCSQHARAKQVTKMSEHLLTTTSDLLNHLATTANCCTSGEDEEEREDERKKKMELEADVAEDKDKRPKSSSSSSAAAASVSHPTAITSQPVVEHRPQTSSLYRTEAKGPDASLRKGPDGTLLTSDYTQASGPDKNLHAGPDRSRRSGPQGAAGPDVSQRCGPQSAILHENRNNSIVAASASIGSHM